jgi:hypothetical protein
VGIEHEREPAHKNATKDTKKHLAILLGTFSMRLFSLQHVINDLPKGRERVKISHHILQR